MVAERNRIKELRQGLGLSQTALSAAIQCTPPYLIFMEKHGYVPQAALRRRVAAALGVTETDVWPDLVELPTHTGE